MSCCVRDKPSRRGFRGLLGNENVWDCYFVELCTLFPTLSTNMGYDFNCNKLESWGKALLERERRLIVKYIFKSCVEATRKPECTETQTFHTHMRTRLKCLELDRANMFHKDGGWCVDLFDTLVCQQDYGTPRFRAMAKERILAFPVAIKKYVQVLRDESRRRPPSCTIVHHMKERIHRMLAEAPQISVATLMKENFNVPIRKTLLPFLETVCCRDTIGLHSYPSLYNAAIYRHVTIDGVSADDIHTFGLSEVNRIEDILRNMPPPDDGAIYRGESAVRKYESIVERVETSPVLVALFGHLRPSRSCQVKEMRESDRKGGPLAYYSNSVFSVNTEYDHREYQMEALAFHESVPGHHLQRSIERQNMEPEYRYHIHHTAFVEGWAMYAEGLMDTTLPFANRDP